jgi:alpha-mannosidase
VLLRRLTEFEVVAGQGGGPDAIALTLVRSVGLMSVNTHPLRDEPAGSELPVPGAQYLGTPVRVELAIAPGWSGREAPELIAAADVFRFEPVAVSGSGDGAEEIPVPPLETSEDVVLESLRRLPDGLEARFVNYASAPRTLAVTTDRPWRRTDLAGEVLDEDVDPTTLSVPGSTIVTLRSEH